jgi:hypothetical protein
MRKAIILIVTLGIALAALPAAALEWDSRLTNLLGVYRVEASPPAGAWYWCLVSGVYEDETESGGNHNIYYKCLDQYGSPIENQACWAGYPTSSPTTFVTIYTKGALDGYWGNWAMGGGNWCPAWPDGGHGPYGAGAGNHGDANNYTDEVWGMGMPCNLHVNYRYIWQWTQSGSTIGTTLVGAGWHLVSIPNTPNDPSPPVVFNPITVSGRLHRYDVSTKSYQTYPAFSSCQVGQGYWLWITATSSFSYLGGPQTGEQTISLAQAGWRLIGHPFTSPVALSQCTVRKTATGESKTVAQARTAGWISLPLYYWDNSAGYQRCGLDPWDSSSSLVTWRGYWLRSNLAGLELHIPAP